MNDYPGNEVVEQNANSGLAVIGLAGAGGTAWGKTLEPGTVFQDCPECPEIVVVPSGEFMMGSPDSEAERDEDEGPVHRVTIPASFAAGKYEVTFDEWMRVSRLVGAVKSLRTRGGAVVAGL